MKKVILFVWLCFTVISIFAQSKNLQASKQFVQAAPGRIQGLKDNNDSTYKFLVYPNDIITHGNRTEMRVGPTYKEKHKYSYCWDFMLNGKYKQREAKGYRIVVGQWLNPPDFKSGEDWGDIKGKQLPPLYFRLNKHDGELYLQIFYGLDNYLRGFDYEMPFKTDKWYHIETEIFWSRGDDGYADIKINDSTYHLKGPNKFNGVDTYMKVGLYRNKNSRDTTESYIKNLSISEIEK